MAKQRPRPGKTEKGAKRTHTAQKPRTGKGKPNLKSTCALSVEKLVLRGSGEGGKLSFGSST